MAIEVVFEKRINNVEVHCDVDSERSRQYVLLTALAALFVVGLLFYGYQQYRWVQVGFEIENAQKLKEELIEGRNQLVLARDSEAREERIELMARELGMIAAAPGQTVILSPDAPLTIPTVIDPAEPSLSASR